MQKLSKMRAGLSVVLLAHAGAVWAENAVFSLPEQFPGSGGLPGPAFPSDLPPAYPEWPERTFRDDFLPPPPPGPYMSSAMSEINVFPENTGGLRPEVRGQPMQSPFFSADLPWPETTEHDRPRPWMPETGEYRFVPEDIVRQLESQSPVARPQYPRFDSFRRFPPPPPVPQPYYGYY